jgi:uncharacterized protein (DUF2249 family)/iron-sulfur cluster repair protein YtfE (RIC family)
MPSTVVIASTAADSAAADAIVAHHAEMVARGAALVDALVGAVSEGDGPGSASARGRLIDWSRGELLPHAAAEEAVLYPVAYRLDDARLLITAMRAEHRAITSLVDRIASTASPIEASAAAAALREVVTGHVWKENELIVPLLAAESSVSLATALDEMHHALAEHQDTGSRDTEAAGADGGHHHDGGPCGCGGHGGPTDAHAGVSCGCGGHESEAAAGVGSRPVLDARAVPHAIRHATVFGALDAVPQGRGLELIAPHDPLPLLAQIERRDPGAFEISYLERGPESWRLAIDRRVAV